MLARLGNRRACPAAGLRLRCVAAVLERISGLGVKVSAGRPSFGGRRSGNGSPLGSAQRLAQQRAPLHRQEVHGLACNLRWSVCGAGSLVVRRSVRAARPSAVSARRVRLAMSAIQEQNASVFCSRCVMHSTKATPNRVAGSFKLPAPTPPTVRVRSGRFNKLARSTKFNPLQSCSPGLCTTGPSR